MSTTRSAILGVGTAWPERSISQEDAASLALQLGAVREDHISLMRRIYANAGVGARGSVALPETKPEAKPETKGAFFGPSSGHDDRGPSTSARLDRYEAEAGPLALRASRAAMEHAGANASQITHVVTASCTGFASPGVDQRLIEELGLRRTAPRLNVGFMGCHAAINALRAADAICRSDDGALALVCAVELCTLHFRYAPSPDQIVANALFGDGAGAAVVGPPHDGALRILSSASTLFPDSREDMTWRIGDHGFEMTLSRRVPELLGAHAPEWIGAWLDGQGLRTRDVGSWAIHPGGPRVVESLVSALALDPDRANASLRTLRERGNVSSPTVLAILESLLTQRAPTPIAALAFGPGLAGEAMLFG